MFEKILICLDGSAAAEKILSHITGEAEKLHSKIVLLRAVSSPETLIPVNVPGSPGLPMSTEASIQKSMNEKSEADDYLKRISGQLQSKGLDTEYVVLTGNAGELIVNYARQQNCTLIAIATHGHGGLRRLALGSTATYVVHHSSIPVLTVRP